MTTRYDPVRNKVIVLSNHWVVNVNAQNGNNTDGFVWELDIANKQWNARLLPTEYTRWTAMSGSLNAHFAPIPGKPSEFLVSQRREIHHVNRAISDNYILKVTDAALTLRPVLPRFGVTMGADRKSAYISVPGDPGEADGSVNGMSLTSGRRKISDDLTGAHTLFVVFGDGININKYSVYLDNSATPLLSNITWAGNDTGMYLSEFVLGARYGTFARYSDISLRKFTGIGNVKARYDWLKVFDKPLTSAEINYWAVAP